MTDYICAVCCENFSGIEMKLYPYLLPCTHIFHIECIKSSAEICGHKCPFCRRDYENMISEAKKHYRLAIMIEKEKVEGLKEEEKEFTILVRDLTNKSYKLNVYYDFTEAKIYDLIAALSGIPNDQFRLVTGSKNLKKDGERILSDLNIRHLKEITKKQIRISKDHCEEVMDTLGNVENGIEFIDLNKEDLEAKKGYAGLLKRCEENEKRISKFETLCDQYNLKLFSYESYNDFKTELRRDQTSRRAFRSDYFDQIESEIINEEKELDIILENKSQNLDELTSLIERREILQKLSQLTQINNYSSNNSNINKLDNNDINNSRNNIINEDYGIYPRLDDLNTNFPVVSGADQLNSNQSSFVENRGGLQFISGVILAENELRLRRTIFRVSYGLGLTTFWDMSPQLLPRPCSSKSLNSLEYNNEINKNKSTNKKITKSFIGPPKKIFTIFLKSSDQENNYLFTKLIKVCDALGATRYNIPPAHAIRGVLSDINHDISRSEQVLEEQISSIRSLIMNKIGSPIQPGKYTLYRVYCKKQKEIYLNLGKCKASNSFYDGEIWVLDKKYNEIVDAIIALSNSSSNHHGTNIMPMDYKSETINPPTFIESNEFLWPFQEIVNTYGIPRYQEINPTVFNIVTFPFLFGVMFGDIGHGFILLLFSFYLCFFAEEIKNKKNSLLRPIVSARYLLLMMGFFSIYCGWIYNEFFSIALPVFGGTCYTGERSSRNNPNVNEYYRNDRNCVYTFGMDPKWQLSQNELSYHNSFKMKLSVILGVFHMLFGIVLKGFNSSHFKNKLIFIFEFIPQIIFMMILFGYMDIMIIIKWLRNWDNNEGNAPSLISQLMNIFLNPGDLQNKPLWEDINLKQSYFQSTWHLIVLTVALICVPIMLFPKPIIEYLNSTSKSKNENNLIEEHNENHADDVQDHHHQEHSFGDIFVHQSIETIEFVLGAVSNTASYLRLWALSLAHGQLAKVFFQKAILGALNSENVVEGVIKLLIGFFIFANATFVVLMCMDVLECFLHTLRLHWVEFQNKFYKADGYKFNPFSFRNLLSSQFDK